MRRVAIIAVIVLIAGAVAAGFLLSGRRGAQHVLVVAATPVPHAEILEQVKPLLLKQGITLEVRVVNDYVTPNIALADGSIDANFFQHEPYLRESVAVRKLALTSVGAVHFEPLALYSSKIGKVAELRDGDRIAVPNDVTNESRALNLLADNGVLKLKDPAKLTSTKADIAAFGVQVEIVELEAAQLPRALSSVTAAVINGNFALSAGLHEAVVGERADSTAAKTYANIIAVRTGDERRADIQALVTALQSPEIRRFITARYKGAVLPVP